MMLIAVALVGCSSGAKVWTQKYDDMTVKEEYQYYHQSETDRRVKNGWYNSYHPNGAYHEVGIYKEDKRDDRWTAYFPNGKIMSEENYRDGRELSPNGVDRFYNLVRSGFYNEQRFFRVIPGFVVQWGMHGDPHVGAKATNRVRSPTRRRTGPTPARPSCLSIWVTTAATSTDRASPHSGLLSQA